MATAPVGSNVPFIGAYQENNALAQQAYQNALNQYNTQYGNTLLQYGFSPDSASNPTNGQFHADYNANPYGMYWSMLDQNNQAVNNADRAAQLHGFDPSQGGLGAQQDELAQHGAGANALAFSQGMQGILNQINTGKFNAQTTYNRQTLQNQLAMIRAATKAGYFTHAVAPTPTGKPAPAGTPKLSASNLENRVYALQKRIANGNLANSNYTLLKQYRAQLAKMRARG